jgi:hypothetical protein
MDLINKIFKSKSSKISKHIFGLQEKEIKKNIKKHLFLICAPKSGSTWLTNILKKTLQWNVVKLLPAFEHREQEIDLSPLFESGVKGNVFSPHQHLRYSLYTEKLINMLDSYLILQLRNIFDTIISYKDHLDKESVKVPAAFMNDENWKLLTEEQKISFVVDLVVPWYFNFYCGWMTSNLYKEGRIKVVTYSDMKKDAFSTVKGILEYINEPTPDSNILNAMDEVAKKNTRKNKGISGRGNQIPDELKKRIVSYTIYYPKVNFDLLGLPQEEIERYS